MHDQKTKISILIPCYNAERWVGQAIESALAQTWSNKEVIVVDDGSTDGSRAVIESYGDRIRYEFGPNRGGNPCRNRLLELASGQWVQFLDADDYLLPEKVEEQLKVSGNSQAVYGPVLIKTEHANNQFEEVCEPEPEWDIYEQWLRWKVCQTAGVLWQRKTLIEIGGWNINFLCCQDNELTLRALKNHVKFSYCENVGTVYRIWSEQTVCRKDPNQVIFIKTQLFDEMIQWLKAEKFLKQKHLAAAGQASFGMARTLAKTSFISASIYAKKQKRKGLWNPVGPAAPEYLKHIMKFCGYEIAELAATTTRNIRGLLNI
jgi:glycosyltransferase involved in cell wall biosynthesis